MNGNKQSDLLTRIKNGDKEAESELVIKYGDKISFIIRRRIGWHHEDCDDLYQDAMLAVLESLRDGKFNQRKGGSLESYIYGITQNKLKDYFKYQKKQEVVKNSPIKDSESVIYGETELKLENKELRKILRNGIAKLKDKYRKVLFLRYFKEYSITEISDHLGIPTRRVSERINYAIKLLKKECDKGNFFSILFSPFLIYV